jgi:hypothetical protein
MSRAYSPECVEDEFCELSLCGVLSGLAEWKLCKAIAASAEHQRHKGRR